MYNCQTYTFKKPAAWSYIPLFDKIGFYRTILDERYAPFVDKLSAKTIVKTLCGDMLQVARVIRILENPDDLRESDLDCNHIIKAAHGCGWNINIQPSLTVDEAKTKLRSWNRTYNTESHIEQHYKYIKPQFFIEEKINDYVTGKSGEAQVFMFRCIHGTPISLGIRRGPVQNSYDMNFQPLKPLEFPCDKPVVYDTMVEIAKTLSSLFEFVRIDLYLGADNTIYFSEFTFTPAAGHPFFSINLERQFGKLWK